MKNILKYKGHVGDVNFDADDKVFHDRVLGIADVIGFEGASVTKLEKDFHEAIDDYMETCLKIGKEPEGPFSGRFILRIPHTLPLHSAITLEAKKQIPIMRTIQKKMPGICFLTVKNYRIIT